MHEDLPKEQLYRLLQAYAKSWLAHDGCWFLAVEEEHGLEEAIRQDERSWARFAPLEAKRVMEARRIPPGGGLEALAEALLFRMYSLLNEQESKLEGDVLTFTMTECRVQTARRRKGLPPFPCKPVGRTEFSRFAEAVDPRITTRCLYCPPDESPEGGVCSWEFRIG
jgi:hypothetical protein